VKIETAEHVEAAHSERQIVRDGLPQVAFVGRSNVGKSSLMNRLLGRKGLARTSSTPGRTRAVHYFLVNRRFYFVDLPGYGYAKVSKSAREEFAQLVDRYFRRTPEPPLVILIVDAKVGPTPLDVQAREYL
jgi:GTP-binding protein